MLEAGFPMVEKRDADGAVVGLLRRQRPFTRHDVLEQLGLAKEWKRRKEWPKTWKAEPPSTSFNRHWKEYRDAGVILKVGTRPLPSGPGKPRGLFRLDRVAWTRMESKVGERRYRKIVTTIVRKGTSHALFRAKWSPSWRDAALFCLGEPDRDFLDRMAHLRSKRAREHVLALMGELDAGEVLVITPVQLTSVLMPGHPDYDRLVREGELTPPIGPQASEKARIQTRSRR